MISDIYWINDKRIGKNKIGIMARPRGNNWLEDEIKWLKIRKVDCLVSLLEKSEEFDLGLIEEKSLCEKWEIEFKSFPIRDVHIPRNEEAFVHLSHILTKKVKEDKSVVIHCRMGIGRASILTAGILVNLGLNPMNVFKVISNFRNLNVPDTEEQKLWLLSIIGK